MMCIMLRYTARVPRYAIIFGTRSCKMTVTKVLRKLTNKMHMPNFEHNKLGTGNKMVQVDETMLNYGCKSHRGRSPENKSDSISIVEIGEQGIERCFAQVIQNKKSATLVPIILNNVVHGAIIHTDEHRSYACLRIYGYTHGSVCHRYNFVDALTGIHTQHVESFHSVVKYWIKNRRGVETAKRQEFRIR